MISAQKKLRTLGNPTKGQFLQRFFKTGPGQYAEGDVFLGITVPETRKVAAEFKNLNFDEIKILLDSKYHEERLLGLVILTNQYQKADPKKKEEIFKAYKINIPRINNWDLVDVSCAQIIGAHLFEKDRAYLYKLSQSKNLWEKRIAIVSTLYFIRKKDFKDTLKICKTLLNDNHDLIHKACGWMLREVGKKDETVLEDFLIEHSKKMPRTMLRYAIEKFEEKKRKKFLQK